MKFIGTIVITDPCYIKNSYRHGGIERSTLYGDWSCMVYPGSIDENKKPKEWNNYYFDFFGKYNLRIKAMKRKRN